MFTFPVAHFGGELSHTISQSIRFNDDDSAFLNRTFGSAGNRKTYTFSGWFKRGNILGANTTLALAVEAGGNNADIHIESGEVLRFRDQGNSLNLITNRVFRDPAAWFHIVASVDTTQSTASNRAKLYLNGSQITSFSTETYMSQDSEGLINSADNVEIGRNPNGSVFWDGYMAELVFIDGQALGPTSFGETNSDTGQWTPIDVSGLTFGSNGYHLQGQDSSALGDDTSGNGNDFTSSGLAAADQVSDSPTDNFATWNPVGSCNVSGQPLTISDGNLRSSAGGTSNAIEAVGTIAPTTGKYYAEFTLNAAPQLTNQYPAIGIIGIDLNITGGNNLNDASFFGYLPSGNKLSGGSSSSYGDTYTNGDIIGIALDLDNQKIYFSKNGTYQNSGDPAAGSNAAFTNLVAGTQYRFCVSHAGSSATDVTMNAGQSAFNTAAPSGYSPMSTLNLPNPTIADPSAHMDTKLYAGNSTDGRAITGYNFAPSWVWIKARNNGYSHNLTDAVRGAGNFMLSNAADAEVDGPDVFGSTLAFTSDGFTLDNGTTSNLYVNQTGTNYAAWCWKANGAGSTDSSAGLSATVSANATAGFSIIKYQGSGSATTVPHQLGVAPKMVIVKDRDNSRSWNVYHDGLSAATKVIYLDQNVAENTDSSIFGSAPTSSVVNIGTGAGSNGSGNDYIMYAFAEVPGYSAFGSYTGSGSAGDGGTFIQTGFKPSWVMLKRIDSGGEWEVSDRIRDPDNPVRLILQPNSSGAEWDATSRDIDWISNGFKHRSAHADFNNGSGSYLFAAFAETAFKHATAR